MKKGFKKMNKVMIGLLAFSAFLLFFVLFTENAGAVLLAPLPGTKNVDSNPGLYISAIYNITIGIAGVLAVLMIVIGGVEYIASAANPSSKESAKKRIWAAIGGLLLALTAYIILSTINPKLVTFNLELNKINSPQGGGGSGGGFKNCSIKAINEKKAAKEKHKRCEKENPIRTEKGKAGRVVCNKVYKNTLKSINNKYNCTN